MPTRNQRTPAKVIKEDLKNGRVTDSLKYLQGQKYVPETYGLLSFHKNADRINTLKRFYPHEPVVNNVRTVYNSLKSKYYSAAITTTAVSWFAIFQFARRGRVLPIFKQYGRFFGTHRVFRHYLYTAILPITLAYYQANNIVVGNVNRLWAIHARRLNNKILDDSMGGPQLETNPNFRVNILKSVIPQ